MMTVKVKEKVLFGTQIFHAGETRLVEKNVGAWLCENGFADDEAGEVATGVRDTTTRKINPANVTIQTR